MKTAIRDAIATQLKSKIREANKFQHNKIVYDELQREIQQLKEIDNKYALVDDTELIKFHTKK